MFGSFILSCKWLIFMVRFKLYNEWMLQTEEGGVNLKNSLLKLGILGIKLGQYLSTKVGISKGVKIILEDLLYSNEVHSLEETNKMINMDPSVCIDSIDPNIIGSGSLAQVYICYLKNDKTKYILKVAHPNIFELDNEVKVLRNILKKVGYFNIFLKTLTSLSNSNILG